MKKRTCDLCDRSLIFDREGVGGMAMAHHLVEEHPEEWEENWTDDLESMWERSETLGKMLDEK